MANRRRSFDINAGLPFEIVDEGGAKAHRHRICRLDTFDQKVTKLARGVTPVTPTAFHFNQLSTGQRMQGGDDRPEVVGDGGLLVPGQFIPNRFRGLT